MAHANAAPDNPHRLAHALLLSKLKEPVRYWRDEFWCYTGSAYRLMPDSEMRGIVTNFAHEELVRSHKELIGQGKQTSTVRPVTTTLVGNVVQALKGLRLLPSDMDAPAWVDGKTGPAPKTLLAMRNGLFDMNADRLLDHDPAYFNTNAVPFDYDPHAPEPVAWLKFLHEVWGGDEESIATLQQWFGYLLTPDTRHQKILFLLGPKRSGKGTIVNVLRELIGVANVAGPTLASLGNNFALSSLLGKSVAVISDARMSGRTDAAVVVERLLSISGEDALTVDRKYREPVTARLPARIVIASNELPRLGDASGALAGRLLILRMTKSWFGNEDHGLLEKLLAELPGVLQWAVKGWKELRAQGRFVQPKTGKELVEDMQELSSPVGMFVRDWCEMGEGLQENVRDVYNSWTKWCESHGEKPGSAETFGHGLRAAVPELGVIRPRADGKSGPRVYTGIKLRPIQV